MMTGLARKDYQTLEMNVINSKCKLLGVGRAGEMIMWLGTLDALVED